MCLQADSFSSKLVYKQSIPADSKKGLRTRVLCISSMPA
jgi:hypothetical protein